MITNSRMIDSTNTGRRVDGGRAPPILRRLGLCLILLASMLASLPALSATHAFQALWLDQIEATDAFVELGREASASGNADLLQSSAATNLVRRIADRNQLPATPDLIARSDYQPLSDVCNNAAQALTAVTNFQVPDAPQQAQTREAYLIAAQQQMDRNLRQFEPHIAQLMPFLLYCQVPLMNLAEAQTDTLQLQQHPELVAQLRSQVIDSIDATMVNFEDDKHGPRLKRALADAFLKTATVQAGMLSRTQREAAAVRVRHAASLAKAPYEKTLERAAAAFESTPCTLLCQL